MEKIECPECGNEMCVECDECGYSIHEAWQWKKRFM